MIRITLHDANGQVALRLEGTLTGDWVGELETAWREARTAARDRAVRVDLRGVCRVDDRGRALLARMHEERAEFVASGCEMPEIVREIAGASEPVLLERI